MSIKEVGFRLRVEKDLRQEFVEICRARDLSAAQVLRAYMRDYVDQNRDALQSDMFDENLRATDLPSTVHDKGSEGYKYD